jgi:exodeoxyribonuclease-3
MKIISWNVNGIRARHNSGHLKQVFDEQADILCLQEVKSNIETIPESLKNLENTEFYLNQYSQPGFAGVAMFTNQKPFELNKGFSDHEPGRVLIADYSDFKLYNIYFPSGAGSDEGLVSKLQFYDRFLETIEKESNENIIICGDFNVAHQEIDLPNPRSACKKAGFLPEEREYLNRLVELGFVDSFREFNKEPEQYSWWSYGRKCREKNIGMRLDYFFVSDGIKKNINAAIIRMTY